MSSSFCHELGILLLTNRCCLNSGLRASHRADGSRGRNRQIVHVLHAPGARCTSRMYLSCPTERFGLRFIANFVRREVSGIARNCSVCAWLQLLKRPDAGAHASHLLSQRIQNVPLKRFRALLRGSACICVLEWEAFCRLRR